MLHQLHGDQSEAEFEAELSWYTTLPEPYVAFLAFDDDGRPIGMMDARVRNYAEGAPSQRAAYVEDLWIEASHRRSGVARALLAAVEQWAREQGLDWLGSDVEDGNITSEHWHAAVGFEFIERITVFGKPLD